MIYKRCSSCGQRLPAGKRCPECSARFIRDKNAYYNKYKRNKEAQSFYDSPLWRKTRDSVMERFDHIDVYKFVMNGTIVPATIVHHIVPLDEDKTKATAVDNLIPVSASSHYEIHRAYDAGKTESEAKRRELRYCIEEYQKKF